MMNLSEKYEAPLVLTGDVEHHLYLPSLPTAKHNGTRSVAEDNS